MAYCIAGEGYFSQTRPKGEAAGAQIAGCLPPAAGQGMACVCGGVVVCVVSWNARVCGERG